MLTVGGVPTHLPTSCCAGRAGPGANPERPLTPAVSWTINLGANVYAVQRMVDHTKPSIALDVYGELWNEDADKLAETDGCCLASNPGSP
jgi:hypothetical protein